MTSPIVIIGSGMAGYTLAREFRKLDKTTPVTIVTHDDGAAYSKPMLSNALGQKKSIDALVQKTAAQTAEATAIAVHPYTAVTTIDRGAKRLHVDTPNGAQTIPYGRLVLALGATPRPYHAPGSDTAPLFSINTLDDYRRWRHALQDGERVLIVGAGLIGVEFANDLALAGHAVTIVDPAPQPLGRLLPDDLGRVMRGALQDAHIAVETGCSITAFDKQGDENRATLSNGQTVAFDRGLVAIGLVPRTDLARAAGLDIGTGIRVDHMLRTSDPNIFALGDCAESPAGVLPFVLPLMAEARALAKTLCGEATRPHLPALPVAVKTPALPLVVCPPPLGSEGRWATTGAGTDLRAIFSAPDGSPLGFALMGKATAERMALAREMPTLLAA